MTGIRLSRPADLGALREIWNASFPGDEAFCDWFLGNAFAPENALVWECAGRALAMLHLLPMPFRAGGRAVPAMYVYAVATMPECRGKGVAAALLTAAEGVARARGAALLMLVPQSESLFEYYRRQGFQTALFRARRMISLDGTPNGPPVSAPGEAARGGVVLDGAPGIAEMDRLFEGALAGRDHAARTEGHWAQSLMALRALGARRGGALVGYAVYDPEGGTVRELIAADEGARAALERGALERLGVREAAAFGPDGPSEPYGMVRAIEPGLEINGAYAGLMLD